VKSCWRLNVGISSGKRQSGLGWELSGIIDGGPGESSTSHRNCGNWAVTRITASCARCLQRVASTS